MGCSPARTVLPLLLADHRPLHRPQLLDVRGGGAEEAVEAVEAVESVRPLLEAAVTPGPGSGWRGAVISALTPEQVGHQSGETVQVQGAWMADEHHDHL